MYYITQGLRVILLGVQNYSLPANNHSGRTVGCNMYEDAIRKSSKQLLYYQPLGRSGPGKPRRRWISFLGWKELKSSILADDDDDDDYDDDNHSIGFQFPF
jgi:hypothetical protein